MKLFVAALLLLGIFELGYSLKCYWCLAPGLENGCSEGTAVGVMECAAKAKRCLAMGVTLGGSQAFERGCAYSDEPVEDECQYMEQFVDEINSCTLCDTDLCNNQPQKKFIN